MIINYLKINGFGKIKNKEINLSDNINIIYGKNEQGKTTTLKFLEAMFYGASKNKNGKDICDFEKYKPWTGDDYSGKLAYTLKNGEEFEVYREFKKKNPKIYNKNGEDISKLPPYERPVNTVKQSKTQPWKSLLSDIQLFAKHKFNE